MKVTVVRPEELGAHEANLWIKFQKLSPTFENPFLSLTYAQINATARPSARIAIVEEGGNIEAFLAYEVASNNVAIPIGGLSNTGLDGLVSSNAPLDVRAVIRKAGLRGWRFSHAPAELRALTPYHYRRNYHGTAISVINLADGYDDYLQSRSRQIRQENRRRRRNIEREFGLISFEWNSPHLELLRQIFEWKSNQYEHSRMVLTDPIKFGIIEELVATTSEDCTGVLNVLRAGERLVAAIFSLAAGTTLATCVSAYDPELARFAPGTMTWLALAEEAVGRDITRIDFGFGQDTYKIRLANHSYPVSGGGVWANQLESAARAIYRRLIYDRFAPDMQEQS